VKWIWDWLCGNVKKLMELPDRPHSIALGTAVGVFIGFTPLYGAKTVLAVILALIVRGNKLAAAIMVNLYDVLFPLLPFIFEAQYQLGEWMLGRKRVDGAVVHGLTLHELLSWTTFLSIGEPLLLGSLVFGAVAAPIAYFIALPLVRRYHISIGRNDHVG
jgi:uncharacterized protein (TIGR03546 family)